jgi:hypothetical protein
VRVGLLRAVDPEGMERGGVGREVEEGEGKRHVVSGAGAGGERRTRGGGARISLASELMDG